MNVLVSGSSGLVGRSLLPELSRLGWRVLPLVRKGARKPSGSGIEWDVETGAIDVVDLQQVGGVDAVVHVAGENLAGGRWSDARKKRIYRSRVDATRQLAASLAGLKQPPKVFVSASAIGIYGNRGDEILTEESSTGTDFLAHVVSGWEHASSGLASSGIRVPWLRFGLILSGEGGALGKMVTPFRMGLGGRLGSGEQWMSWVSIRDVVRVILFALENSAVEGAYNVVSPNAVRNREFTEALAKEVHRPAILPVPRFALRLVFGEMTDAALLASQRVVPKRLENTGFEFEDSELVPTLKRLV